MQSPPRTATGSAQTLGELRAVRMMTGRGREAESKPRKKPKWSGHWFPSVAKDWPWQKLLDVGWVMGGTEDMKSSIVASVGVSQIYSYCWGKTWNIKNKKLFLAWWFFSLAEKKLHFITVFERLYSEYLIYFKFSKQLLWDLPTGPVVKTLSFHCRGAQVQFLLGELRSHMPWALKLKK